MSSAADSIEYHAREIERLTGKLLSVACVVALSRDHQFDFEFDRVALRFAIINLSETIRNLETVHARLAEQEAFAVAAE